MDDPFVNISLLGVMWTIFSHGGFLFIVGVLVYAGFKLYVRELQNQFASTVKHTFLKFGIPKENKISMMAIENIFAQMHAVHTGLTFTNKFIEGKFQLTYHCEIVSFGGKVSLLMRVPEKTKDLVMAAFYSQYPDCEITEVEDYMKNIRYSPDDPNCPYEIFGFEWEPALKQYNPIKTYKDFADPGSEQKVIDPLSPLWESLNQLQPHEFYGIQMSIQPLADGDWKSKSEAYAKELITGEKEHKAGTIFTTLMKPLHAFAAFKPTSLLQASAGGHGHGDKEEAPRTWMNLTDVQKEQVTLVQRKAGKPAYNTKIRHLYIAPKDKFDGNKKMVIIGAMRNLGSINHNQYKPDTKETWTGKDFLLSPSLEKPYLDYLIKKRKRHFIHGYKGRDNIVGLSQHILNVEEIATLFHFPLTTQLLGATPAPIERIEAKKVAPPVNLPIG